MISVGSLVSAPIMAVFAGHSAGVVVKEGRLGDHYEYTISAEGYAFTIETRNTEVRYLPLLFPFLERRVGFESQLGSLAVGMSLTGVEKIQVVAATETETRSLLVSYRGGEVSRIPY